MIRTRTILLTAIAMLGLALPGRAQQESIPHTAFSDPNQPGSPQSGPPQGGGQSAPPDGGQQKSKLLSGLSNLFARPQENDAKKPSDSMDATDSPNGAFSIKEGQPDEVPVKCYFGIGLTAMRRSDLYRGDVASIPLANGNTYIDYQSVPMNFNFGVRGEIGVMCGPGAFELSGFNLFASPSSSSTSGTNMNVYFTQFAPPAGFNAALWSPASHVTIGYSVAVGNAELNYRWQCLPCVEILAGARYMDVNENINISTDSPVGATNYAFQVQNRIVGPQLGAEFEWRLIPQVSVSFLSKGALGVNFVDIGHTLTQSNGVSGPGGNTNITELSGIVEIGLFTHIWLNERIKLRLGYEAMWLLHLPEAQAQISFNANLAAGNQLYNGSLFFQGPVFELQIAF